MTAQTAYSLSSFHSPQFAQFPHSLSICPCKVPSRGHTQGREAHQPRHANGTWPHSCIVHLPLVHEGGSQSPRTHANALHSPSYYPRKTLGWRLKAQAPQNSLRDAALGILASGQRCPVLAQVGVLSSTSAPANLNGVDVPTARTRAWGGVLEPTIADPESDTLPPPERRVSAGFAANKCL
jgi:hypothetical protein